MSRELLDPSVARFLGDFFGQDVSSTKVYGGRFAGLLTRVAKAGAITLGRNVFLGGLYWRAYKNKTAFGISVAGHEIRHALDFRQHGFVGFLARYVAGWASAGFRYGNNRWEQIAETAEHDVYTKLLSDDGLLLSIQNDTYRPGNP